MCSSEDWCQSLTFLGYLNLGMCVYFFQMTDKQKSSVKAKHLSENTTDKFALAEKKNKTDK